MAKPRFDFYPRGFENTPHPCLVVDDPNGGDPHILALLSVIYRPTDLQGLCDMANAYLDSIDPPPKCPVCKGQPAPDGCEYCPDIDPPPEPEGPQPVSNSYKSAETHIDRECRALGHEFAYEPGDDEADGPMTCMHCGADDPTYPWHALDALKVQP